MIQDRWKLVEQIFNTAVELPQQERPSFLQNACGNDPELRREVESLLEQDDGTGDMLGTLVSEAADSLSQEEIHDLTGKTIGSYLIMGLVGRGGMAEVYRAIRGDDQYKKQVAIKLVRRNLAPSFFMSRFRHERQILASLEHRSIARFLEGGTTDGIPYLVMEYIDGEPITDYCNKRDLPVRERLELFRSVCDAVQYAHRNLVIHRDLKPSNILVTSEGVTKLLDFGIAKLLNPELTDGLPTATISPIRLMTPEYASPEQVRGEQVTTATDVYSLGAVLYELLTQERPHQFKTRSILEIERVICNVEPERPSSAVLRAQPADAAQHTGNRKKLSRELARELDNVVLMAMQKDPRLRYPTAWQFAEDIERYLDGRPVQARAQTVGYRAIKFARRHKTAVTAAVLLVAMLAGFAAIMAVQASRIAKERDRANEITEFLVNLFEVSNPGEARGNNIRARELLDASAIKIGKELQHQPEVQAALMDTIGRVYRNLGLYNTSISLLEKSLEIRRRILSENHADVASTMDHLATAYKEVGKYEDAESLARKALATRQQLLGSDHRDVAESAGTVGDILQDRGKYDEAESFFRMELAIHQKLFGEEHEKVAESLNQLALLLKIKGKLDEAEPLYRKTLAMRRKLLGSDHPAVASDLNNLGRFLTEKGEYPEAEALLREAMEVDLKVLGKDHPDRAIVMSNLALLFREKKEFDNAEMLYREALALRRKGLGDEHPSVARNVYSLAVTLVDKGDYDQAEPLLLEARRLFQKSYPPGHPEHATLGLALARIRIARKDPKAAEILLDEALKIRMQSFPSDHPGIANVKSALGECLMMQGSYAKAEPVLLDAYRICNLKWGKNHSDSIKAAGRLVSLYEAWGKPEKAANYRAK